MSINERIKEARKKANISQKDLAEKIGISMNGLSMIERGINNPSKQTIELFCRELNVNKVWLETGEGEMEAPKIPDIDAVIADMIRNDDDPVYLSFIKAARVYMSLDEMSRKVVRDVMQKCIDKMKKDPE